MAKSDFEHCPKPKRFKVEKACYHCRVKKIKCDGLQPCMQCKARERPCSFSKSGEGATNNSEPFISPPITDITQTTEILDKLQKVCPSDWDFDTSTHFFQQLKPSAPTTSTEENEIHALGLLPNKDIQIHCIQGYYDRFYATFPILPKRLFLRQFNQDLISPLLILVIMAHGTNNRQFADVYFQQASMLFFQSNFKPTPNTVIALMLMSLYESDENKNPSIYVAIAIQMCFDLYLLKDYYSIGDSDLKEQQKRICWGCYVLDKLVHIQPGQPWLLKSKDINLDMPLFQPGDDIAEHSILESFVATIKLLQIAEPLLRPDFAQHQTLMVYDQPDHDLARWLRSLPPHLQWTPSVDKTTTSNTPPVSAMACQLHLVYNVVEMFVTKHIESRIANTASNLIRIITFLSEKQEWMFNQHFIVYALLECTKLNLQVCSCDNLNLARNANFMFQQSILGLKNVLCAAKTTTIRLAITEFTQNLEKVIHEAADKQQQKLLFNTNYAKPPSITMSSTMFVPNHLSDEALFYEMMSPHRFQSTNYVNTKSQLSAVSSPSTFHSQSNSTNDLESLVAQIQEKNSNNEALYTTSSSSTTTTATQNDEDLLFSLLSSTEHRTANSKKSSNPYLSYMNVGLGIYASAHQHHNDVIKQHLRISPSNHRNQ